MSKKYIQKNKIIDFLQVILKKKNFLVSLVLVGVIMYTYLVYIPTLGTASSSNNVFLNPSIVFIKKKDLIVNFQNLRDSLTNKYEKRKDYMVSIYFEYLPTGANISINKDEKIWPASLIKIPIAMAAMKKVQDKKWNLDNELVILDQDKDSEYGELYKEPSGTTFTIRRFLEEALINSDNTAHFVLLRNLDGGELEEVYNHLGMDDIINALKQSPSKEAEVDNRITAKRYSTFFRSLYNSTFLTPEYSELFLSILGKAPKELLNAGIPDDVSFVHKTGIRIDEGVRADSGIVYLLGRPYIITVMVQQKAKGEMNEKEIDQIFGDISKEIFTYVKNIN